MTLIDRKITETPIEPEICIPFYNGVENARKTEYLEIRYSTYDQS